jgi:hypothetical protein
MAALIVLLLNLLASVFKPKSRLEAENAALRRLCCSASCAVGSSSPTAIASSSSSCIAGFHRFSRRSPIIRPETLVRWHRAGFRHFWRCKSRNLGGRPQISADLRALIRRMSVENVLWGAPRIHGELLKLGFAVAESTVAKYMAKKGDPSGQRWGTFLRNHMPHIAAMDLFVVPTISFNLLYILVIVRLARRELAWINVTAHALFVLSLPLARTRFGSRKQHARAPNHISIFTVRSIQPPAQCIARAHRVQQSTQAACPCPLERSAHSSNPHS